MRAYVYSLERINNTVNGNPRYRVHTDQGTMVSMSDAGTVYAWQNWSYPRECNLTLTKAGRVRDIKPAD